MKRFAVSFIIEVNDENGNNPDDWIYSSLEEQLYNYENIVDFICEPIESEENQ